MSQSLNQNIIALITGSADGIGKQTALELAEAWLKVIIHGRAPARCEKTVTQLKSRADNPRINFKVADFASLQEVRRMSDDLRNIRGEYYVDMKPAKSSELSHNPELRKKIWRLSEGMVADYRK